MKNGPKIYFLSLLIGAPFVVAGVLFRPFWHSEWGMPTFILIFWIVMSLGAGWGGKGRPYSLRFGLIVSTSLSLCLAVTVFINKYAGIGLVCLLFYVAVKSKFLEKRSRELAPGSSEAQS